MHSEKFVSVNFENFGKLYRDFDFTILKNGKFYHQWIHIPPEKLQFGIFMLLKKNCRRLRFESLRPYFLIIVPRTDPHTDINV